MSDVYTPEDGVPYVLVLWNLETGDYRILAKDEQAESGEVERIVSVPADEDVGEYLVHLRHRDHPDAEVDLVEVLTDQVAALERELRATRDALAVASAQRDDARRIRDEWRLEAASRAQEVRDLVHQLALSHDSEALVVTEAERDLLAAFRRLLEDAKGGS